MKKAWSEKWWPFAVFYLVVSAGAFASTWWAFRSEIALNPAKLTEEAAKWFSVVTSGLATLLIQRRVVAQQDRLEAAAQRERIRILLGPCRTHLEILARPLPETAFAETTSDYTGVDAKRDWQDAARQVEVPLKSAFEDTQRGAGANTVINRQCNKAIVELHVSLLSWTVAEGADSSESVARAAQDLLSHV